MTNDQPLISVIVPVYKVEKYLDKCVTSIVNQTYKNLEIILVDDGSPDSCPAMCDEWAKRDTRIRVIHKENGGLSSARNAGLDIMTGEFAGFIDSDDYIASKMYETLYDLMKSYSTDLSICDYVRVDENGNKLDDDSHYSQPLIKVYSREKVLSAFVNREFKWLKGYLGVSWNKLYSHEIFKSLRFPEGFRYEDDLTIHYILGSCKRAVVTSEAFYFYLQREGSIMSQVKKCLFSPDYFNVCFKIHKERSNYLTRQGMPELAEKVLFDLYAMWANDLRKINYLQFRKKLNKSLIESISMLMRSKKKTRVIKLFIRLLRSMFRPYI